MSELGTSYASTWSRNVTERVFAQLWCSEDSEDENIVRA